MRLVLYYYSGELRRYRNLGLKVVKKKSKQRRCRMRKAVGREREGQMARV